MDRNDFHPAADEVVRIVTAADVDTLEAPTPCVNFDVGELVNHFVGTMGALARVGERQALDPEDPYGARQNPSREDWRRILADNIEAVRHAWSKPAAWEGTVTMGGQQMPAPMIAEMALAEMLLHGWDLARATGQQLDVPDRVAGGLRRSVEETAELGRTMGAYGDAVPVSAAAGELDRALGASGRDPRWRAD